MAMLIFKLPMKCFLDGTLLEILKNCKEVQIYSSTTVPFYKIKSFKTFAVDIMRTHSPFLSLSLIKTHEWSTIIENFRTSKEPIGIHLQAQQTPFHPQESMWTITFLQTLLLLFNTCSSHSSY